MKTYAFTLAGSTSVYAIGEGLDPAAVATAAIGKITGEPVVYAETHRIYAEAEAYVVPADFAEVEIDEDRIPTAWLQVDTEATALAKVVAKVRTLPNVIELDDESGLFSVERDDGSRVEWHGRTFYKPTFTYTAPDGAASEVEIDIMKMRSGDDEYDHYERFLRDLETNLTKWIEDVVALGREKIAQRAAA